MNPLVSVIIPTFNQALYLKEAIESVLKQTYVHLELIIIDDGSTDQTQHLCQEFQKKDGRLKYIKQINQGPSVARNRGIQASNGEFIAILDADDLMLENRLQIQLNVLKSNKDIDISYTALELIDEKGKPLGELVGSDEKPENFLALMFVRNQIPGPSYMGKRTCFINHPFNEKYRHAEDYELMLRLAHLYRFKYTDLPLTKYRRHGSNLSNHLDEHRKTASEVLASYGYESIAKVIDGSSLPDKNLTKGLILYNFHDWEKAYKQFDLAKDQGLALFYKGNCLMNLQNIDKAIETYEESIRISKEEANPACVNNLGVAYAKKEKWDSAQLLFSKALALKNDYLDAKENLEATNTDQLKLTFRELRQNLIPYKTL